MTDSTADAKLSARAERALRHLPEIAEILDRDNDRPIVAEEARLAAALIRDLTNENTRPQPAPPAGEPDWEQVIEQAFFVLSIKTLNRDEFRAELIALARHAYGLAARPKVEDAEVKGAVERLHCMAAWTSRASKMIAADKTARNRTAGDAMACYRGLETEQTFEWKFADLLERLAGDLADWQTLADAAKRSMEAAESKLAEREAELAKADAVIVWAFEKLEPGQHGISHGRFESDASVPTNAPQYRVIELAKERHAARQQKKARGD